MQSDKHIRGRVRRLLDVMAENLLISVMTLVVVFVFVLLPLSFSRFNTAQTMREQYNLMDAYFAISNRIANERPYRYASNEVIVVDIAGIYDRERLADILEMTYMAKPRVLGLDVFFENRNSEEADNRILRVVADQKVVSPVILSQADPEAITSFWNASLPFYMNNIHHNSGFVNVASSGASQTVRAFPKYLSLGKITIPNLDIAIVREASRPSYLKTIERNNDSEYINYSLSSFTSISAESLPYNADLLKDRVVIIGDRSDIADMHLTPLGPRTPGVDIHAMSIATMLEDKYINVMSEFGAWILAFVSIFLLLSILRILKRNSWLSVFCPVIQTLMILVAVFICYMIFVSCGYYVRVVYALLGIGFLDFAYNLYYKIKDVCVKYFSH